MRGRLPLPPIPGKPQGAASPTPRGGLRRRPSPGYYPRRLPLPPTPAEGSRPLPTDRTIDGGLRKPPGRACPAPTARRPGNGCPRKPRGRFHIPIRRAGCPHPAATSRRRQQQPLPSPLGEGGPAGPDEGQAPLAAHSRATRRGRRPRRPAEACAAANNGPCLPPWGKVAPQGRMRGRLPLPPIPGKPQGAASPTPRGGLRRRPSPGYYPRRLPLPPTPAEGSRPLPTDRTIDACPRKPAGRACPAPTA